MWLELQCPIFYEGIKVYAHLKFVPILYEAVHFMVLLFCFKLANL